MLVIEDDHAAELAGVPLHPLAGATAAWAFVRSVSKPYGPDLRLAVLAGDPATVARVEGRLRLGAGWVSTLLQRLVVSLWRDPRGRRRHRRRPRALRAAAHRTARGAGRPRRGGSGSLRASTCGCRWPTRPRWWPPCATPGTRWLPGSRYRLAAAPGIRITVSPLDPSVAPAVAEAVAAAVTGPARARPTV